MAAKSYRVKIARDGYDFEAEGDKAFVLQMLNRFAPEAESASKTDDSDGKTKKQKKINQPSQQISKKSISIREFIQKLDFKKHTDITTAFAYYLEKHMGMSAFSRADINNCYYEAKLESSNTSQMIIQNIKRGFMMAAKKNTDDKKAVYTLTSSGEAFIEATLSGAS